MSSCACDLAARQTGWPRSGHGWELTEDRDDLFSSSFAAPLWRTASCLFVLVSQRRLEKFHALLSRASPKVSEISPRLSPIGLVAPRFVERDELTTCAFLTILPVWLRTKGGWPSD